MPLILVWIPIASEWMRGWYQVSQIGIRYSDSCSTPENQASSVYAFPDQSYPSFMATRNEHLPFRSLQTPSPRWVSG